MEGAVRIEDEHVSRGVVPGRKVHVEQGKAAVMIVPPRLRAVEHACAPQIEVIREGAVVRAIDVTCTCGQKIRLRCAAEEPAAGG